MPGSSFGTAFRVTAWGESHGPGIGVVVDGCPPGLALTEEDVQHDLDRRRPGQSALVTPRKEEDRVRIESGVYRGQTTGHPIAMSVRNRDARPGDYRAFGTAFRPGHADFTLTAKYGIRDPGGGGRSSARVTVAHVAAGAVARALLTERCGASVTSWVRRVHDIEADVQPESVTREQVDRTPTRCPDADAAARIEALITRIRAAGDSVGGVVECCVLGVPPGLGEPVFDKLEADLARAMLAINASKGFEIGSGFAGARMRGSQHNDAFTTEAGRVVTTTNHAGGVLGGISTGMPIVFRVAFKPTSTIRKPQTTVDALGREVTLAGKGRHDPCVLPRAVPIVEAMACLVLADHALRQAALRRSADLPERRSPDRHGPGPPQPQIANKPSARHAPGSSVAPACGSGDPTGRTGGAPAHRRRREIESALRSGGG